MARVGGVDSVLDDYRSCVGLMLLNRSGEVFVGQRSDTSRDNWQMPQGGIDDGEDSRAAALRELYEETGILPDKVEFLHSDDDWRTYDLPSHLVPRFWGGRYRGQKQKWFLLAFLGDDSDICLEAGGEHSEFLAWRWLSPVDLPEIIIEFKRDLYTALVADFLPHISRYIEGERS